MSPSQQRNRFRGRTRWATAARQATSLVLGMLTAGEAAAQPPVPSHAIAFPPPLSYGLNAPAAFLPVNLVVPNSILPLARSMWLRSPTFRRQCRRLSEHPEMVVQFEFTARVERGAGRT